MKILVKSQVSRLLGSIFARTLVKITLFATLLFGSFGLVFAQTGTTGGTGGTCAGHTHSDAAGAGGIGSTVSCPSHTHTIDANNLSNLAAAIDNVIANTTPPPGDPGDPVVPDATEDDACP